MATTILGYRELVERYEEITTERSVAVTRVFFYDKHSATGDDGSPVISELIPEIGDGWNYWDEWTGTGAETDRASLNEPSSNCRCRHLEIVSNGSPDCWELIAEYSNEPTSVGQYTSDTPPNPDFESWLNGLPISMQFSGEYVSLNPENRDPSGVVHPSGWKWLSDDADLVQGLAYRVPKINLRISATVNDTNYNKLIAENAKTVGKVNIAVEADPDAEGLFAKYSGCWIYQGLTSSPYRNDADVRVWDCDLVWEFRAPATSDDPSATSQNGWLKLLRRSGEWDIPIYLLGEGNWRYIYPVDAGNFANLIDLLQPQGT